MSALVHFLLVFDHNIGRLVEQQPYHDGEEAVAAYAMKEQEYEACSLFEIVLIGSDSLDTIKLTHANYFDGSVSVSKYLAGI